MPVFPLKQYPDPAGFFPLESTIEHHLRHVLRKGKGDPFQIALPDGKRCTALLQKKEGRWVGKIIKKGDLPPIPMLPLWIGIGMIRWSRLEWFIEKATEFGVSRISLLIMRKGRYSPHRPLSEKKVERLQKIAQETLKQCQRSRAPQIDPPQALSDWIPSIQNHEGTKLLFLEGEASPLLQNKHFSLGEHHLFLIGPEGGFEDQEIFLAEENGFTPVSLGPKILKTETAALYGISCLDAFLLGSS